MKKFIQSLSIIICLFFIPPFAGANDEIDIKRAIANLQTDKKRIISENMELTQKESEAFWPEYDRYQEALLKVAHRTLKFIGDYAEEQETLSDKRAGDMMVEFLAIPEEKLKLKKSFVKEFNKILPPKKLIRYFQLENKIEAAINYEIATQIPLVE